MSFKRISTGPFIHDPVVRTCGAILPFGDQRSIAAMNGATIFSVQVQTICRIKHFWIPSPIGNFVEVKNFRVGRNSLMRHPSPLPGYLFHEIEEDTTGIRKDAVDLMAQSDETWLRPGTMISIEIARMPRIMMLACKLREDAELPEYDEVENQHLRRLLPEAFARARGVREISILYNWGEIIPEWVEARIENPSSRIGEPLGTEHEVNTVMLWNLRFEAFVSVEELMEGV